MKKWCFEIFRRSQGSTFTISLINLTQFLLKITNSVSELENKYVKIWSFEIYLASYMLVCKVIFKIHISDFFQLGQIFGISWQKMSGKNAQWVIIWTNELRYSKSDKFERVCAIINHTQILRQKLSFMMLITNTNFVFKLRLVFVPIWGKTLVPYCRTKRQKNHCFNMVHLRKISLAESRGSSRFFNNKVVSDFDFGHFLKKSI